MTTKFFSLNLSSTKRLLISLDEKNLIIQEQAIFGISIFNTTNEIHIPISNLKSLIECLNGLVKFLPLL